MDGVGEGAAAGAGVDGWGLLVPEGREQFVDVLVEGAVELAVDVVEVAGLPDAADLTPGLGEGVALDGVLDQDPAAGAV
jgi:predicted S18 family serine protease